MKFTPTKRRLTTSHLPILEPGLNLALPSYPIYSNSLPLPSLIFYGPSPPRASRGSAIHVFLVLDIVLDFFNVLHNDTLEISYHVISPHYSLTSFPEQGGNHHEDPKALLDTLDQPLIYDHD